MQAVSSAKWTERAPVTDRKQLLLKVGVSVKQVQTAKFLFMENKSKFTMEGWRTFIYGDF